MRKRHGFLIQISTPTREKLAPWAPPPTIGRTGAWRPGDQHRGLRGNELCSIDLRLVVISPARPRSFPTSSMSPFGNRLAPSSVEPTPRFRGPIPPLSSPRKRAKSRGITTSVASRGHGAGSSLSSPRPTGHIGEVRGVGRRKQTKKRPRDQGLLERKKAGFPADLLHALPLRGAFPAVVTESSERHERDQKRAEKAWSVALSAPRHSCSMAAWHWPAGIGRLLNQRASLARWGIGPDRARLVTAGLGNSGRLFACLCRRETIRWVACLGGSSYLLISFSCAATMDDGLRAYRNSAHQRDSGRKRAQNGRLLLANHGWSQIHQRQGSLSLASVVTPSTRRAGNATSNFNLHQP